MTSSERASPTEAHAVIAGVSFADPDKWLENDDEAVLRWQREQAARASAYVHEWPFYEQVFALVSRFNREPRHGDQYRILPRYEGGSWFRTRPVATASHSVVVVADQPMAEGRIIFDPASLDAQRPPFVSWIAPSPDGQIVAVGICADGSENNHIELVDVATGRTLDAPPRLPLMDNWTGGVQWLPDSRSFYYSAIKGRAVDFEQDVVLHKLDPVASTSTAGIKWTTEKDYRWVVISRDQRTAVGLERLVEPTPVALRDLGEPGAVWRPSVTVAAGRLAGHVVEDRYVAVTDIGAPRGRVVAIPLAANRPNDPDSWVELVPESDAVLQALTPVGTYIYLTEFVGTYARVRIVDAVGREVGLVPLPDRGALGNGWWQPMHSTAPRGHPERFLFTFSSLRRSPGIYSHTPGAEELDTLLEPEVLLGDVVVEDHVAQAADGTGIPYQLVRRREIPATKPQPTLIHGYGAYNFPVVPQFPGAMAAFIAAGGSFVLAHLRGGGEFGLEWWRSARFETKQTTFDDLYAIAESLIASGRSTRELLAITGRSAGGHMAGVAMTQRPDLWKVALLRVPALDLIAQCRDPYGRKLVIESEFGDPDDPGDLQRIAGLSPYHLIRDGVHYPAVFIDAGSTDPRCPPWHARKFAARLQKATAGGPVLLHIWENAGHGLGAELNTAVIDLAEWIAFGMRQLGMEPTHLMAVITASRGDGIT